MTERFLKLSEVRQFLGVSRATVWRWTTERGQRVVKVGSVARVRESDLQAFLKQHESGESAGAAGRINNGT
jgi:excisionase family DNA binding protein